MTTYRSDGTAGNFLLILLYFSINIFLLVPLLPCTARSVVCLLVAALPVLFLPKNCHLSEFSASTQLLDPVFCPSSYPSLRSIEDYMKSKLYSYLFLFSFVIFWRIVSAVINTIWIYTQLTSKKDSSFNVFRTLRTLLRFRSYTLALLRCHPRKVLGRTKNTLYQSLHVILWHLGSLKREIWKVVGLQKWGKKLLHKIEN